MGATKQARSSVTLCDGRDFSIIETHLVVAMIRFDLVHLDRLGDIDADFRLSPTTARAASL